MTVPRSACESAAGIRFCGRSSSSRRERRRKGARGIQREPVRPWTQRQGMKRCSLRSSGHTHDYYCCCHYYCYCCYYCHCYCCCYCHAHARICKQQPGRRPSSVAHLTNWQKLFNYRYFKADRKIFNQSSAPRHAYIDQAPSKTNRSHF